MCTLTILRTEDALVATMNRDEARTRGPEWPPARRSASTGRAWIAPRDGDTGGTWFGVNDRGIVACILNRYQDYSETNLPANPATRAEIVPSLLSLSSLDNISTQVSSDDESWAHFPPFTLVAAALNGALRADWNGSTMEVLPLAQPWDLVTSSGLDTARVLTWRRAAFERWISAGAPRVEGIPAIHLHRPPGDEEFAPLMSRDISSTRSISQASVSRSGTIGLRYGAVVDGVLDWDNLLRVHTLSNAS